MFVFLLILLFKCNAFSLLQVFAQLLQAPKDDAQAIIHERFPVPRLVVCDQHGSQVSFISLSSSSKIKPLWPCPQTIKFLDIMICSVLNS
jgi:hypothetical protein